VPALAGLAVAAGAALLALTPVAAAIIPITLGFGTLAAFAGPEVVKVFKAMTAQGTALKTAMKNLSPAERDLLNQLEPLRDQFGALKKAVQPEIMKAFGEAIKIVKDLMPALKPLVKAAAQAVDEFLKKLLNWLNSPQGQSFINWLKTVGPKDIKNFGRVLWDVAHGVGDALHFIYSTGSVIDRFLTHWGDDWKLVKTTAQLQWDQIKISALRLVYDILGAFTQIPFIGGEFKKARQDIGVELGRIRDDTRRAVNELQAAWDSLHGKKVSIQFTTAFVASHGVPVAPAARGMFVSGGRAGVDDQLIAAQRGELVVPTRLVSSGAVDHLRGQIPGFAAGGMVGSGWNITDFFVPRIATAIKRMDATANAFENAGAAYVQAHPLNYWKFGGFGGGGGLGGGPGGPVEAVARSLFPWPSFNYVEMREAGYNLNARNPTSGAFGVAQFISGPSEYFQWGGNPFTAAGQFTGMFNYIRSRYGVPSNAAAHEAAFNWYDQGGWLPPGLSLALNTTGQPERVGGGGGTTIVIQNLNVTAQDPASLVSALQAHVKRNGPIKLKVRS